MAKDSVANESYQGPLSYLWHWWINSLKPDGPAGDPHERNLYGFKSMLQALGYFETYLRAAFTDSLRESHQQCLHQQPEPIKDKNCVRCALGKNVVECPILLSLRDSFNENRARHEYQARVPESALYELMAKTCGWHLLMSQVIDGRLIDWNEGAMQDESDRMFWTRTYESLASGPEDAPDA